MIQTIKEYLEDNLKNFIAVGNRYPFDSEGLESFEQELKRILGKTISTQCILAGANGEYELKILESSVPLFLMLFKINNEGKIFIKDVHSISIYIPKIYLEYNEYLIEFYNNRIQLINDLRYFQEQIKIAEKEVFKRDFIKHYSAFLELCYIETHFSEEKFKNLINKSNFQKEMKTFSNQINAINNDYHLDSEKMKKLILKNFDDGNFYRLTISINGQVKNTITHAELIAVIFDLCVDDFRNYIHEPACGKAHVFIEYENLFTHKTESEQYSFEY